MWHRFGFCLFTNNAMLTKFIHVMFHTRPIEMFCLLRCCLLVTFFLFLLVNDSWSCFVLASSCFFFCIVFLVASRHDSHRIVTHKPWFYHIAQALITCILEKIPEPFLSLLNPMKQIIILGVETWGVFFYPRLNWNLWMVVLKFQHVEILYMKLGRGVMLWFYHGLITHCHC